MPGLNWWIKQYHTWSINTFSHAVDSTIILFLWSDYYLQLSLLFQNRSNQMSWSQARVLILTLGICRTVYRNSFFSLFSLSNTHGKFKHPIGLPCSNVTFSSNYRITRKPFRRTRYEMIYFKRVYCDYLIMHNVSFIPLHSAASASV